MNNNIYVNDNNVIYNYEVSFDREEFERVIDESLQEVKRPAKIV